MKIRKQVTLHPDLLKDAESLEKLLSYNSLSDLLEALIRQEKERRFGRERLMEESPPYTVSASVSSTPPGDTPASAASAKLLKTLGGAANPASKDPKPYRRKRRAPGT